MPSYLRYIIHNLQALTPLLTHPVSESSDLSKVKSLITPGTLQSEQAH